MPRGKLWRVRFVLIGLLAGVIGLAWSATIPGTLAQFNARTTNPGAVVANNVLGAPSGLAISGSAPMTLTWTATSSTWAVGHRVFRGTSSGGPYFQVAQIAGLGTTTFSENPGAGNFYYVVQAYYNTNGSNWTSTSTNEVVRIDPVFVLNMSTSNTGTNCSTAQVTEDLQQAYTPAGPEQSFSRTGGNGTASFCSTTFSAGRTLLAGTTTISAYFDNNSGSTCNITAQLWLNGTTLLGSGTQTMTSWLTKSLQTWSFATNGVTFAAGDRLNLRFNWQSVKSCDSTDLYWNGAATPSSVMVPGFQ